MKFTALLLSAYINFLMVQPASVEVSLTSSSVKKYSKQSCCTLKKETQKQDCQKPSKDNCAKGICNPFGECTCCLAISIVPSYQFSSFVPAKELIETPSADLFSHYLADCFHPPKEV